METATEQKQEHKKALKYMQLAQYNANLFSKDPHCKVGAILLNEDFTTILACGINGMPRKMNDNNQERWKKPTKYQYVCHAEANAVANAARKGMPLDGAVAAVTKFPCSMCTRLLIQAGIKTIFTPEPNYDSHVWGNDAKVAEEMLDEVGIKVVKLAI